MEKIKDCELLIVVYYCMLLCYRIAAKLSMKIQKANSPGDGIKRREKKIIVGYIGTAYSLFK